MRISAGNGASAEVAPLLDLLRELQRRYELAVLPLSFGEWRAVVDTWQLRRQGWTWSSAGSRACVWQHDGRSVHGRKGALGNAPLDPPLPTTGLDGSTGAPPPRSGLGDHPRQGRRGEGERPGPPHRVAGFIGGEVARAAVPSAEATAIP